MYFLDFVKRKKGNSKNSDEKKIVEEEEKTGPLSSSENYVCSNNMPLRLNSPDAANVPAQSANWEAADIEFSDLVRFHNQFHLALTKCGDIHERNLASQKLKKIAEKIKSPEYSFDFNSEFENQPQLLPMKSILEEIVSYPPPQRSRYALALFRFASTVALELEEEEFSCGTNFFSCMRGANCLSQFNPNLVCSSAEDNSPSAAPTATQLPPPPTDFDPKKMFQEILSGNMTLPKPEYMVELLRRVTEVLQLESNVVMVPLPCVVVGDIHGQIRDLLHHIIPSGGPLVPPEEDEKDSQSSEKPHRNYLFLGDYVDRGPSSLHCLMLLFSAKLLSPRTVFLLRGNHESRGTNRLYGFLEECHKAYPIIGNKLMRASSELMTTARDGVSCNGEIDCEKGGLASPPVGIDWGLGDHPIWNLANQAFECMPLSAAIYQPSKTPHLPHESLGKVVICAMHGGISPFIESSLDGILALNRFKEIEVGALADLTWSDPIISTSSFEQGANGGPWKNNSATMDPLDMEKSPVYAGPPVGFSFSARGTGHNFGEDMTCLFLQANKLRFLIRAHQCVSEGYQWTHQHRLLTVFSASNYCGMGNKGAVVLLDENGKETLVQHSYEVAGSALEAMNIEATQISLPDPIPPKEFM